MAPEAPAPIRLPDFIIAGAPRSGTTWLYSLLDRHPEIHMARPAQPEPKFFLVDELYARGLEYYSRTWFADIGSARVCGEKSTNYLEGAKVAGRIAEALPEVKLVFILRNPVDRCYSNYLWSRMNGLEQEDFAGALALEEGREAEAPEELRYARPHAYFSRGLYAELLEPFFLCFSRERILCLRFEDIMERRAELVERVHGFLGVAPRAADGADLGQVNPSRQEGGGMPEEVRRDLARRYAGSNRRLVEMLGPAFGGWEER